MTKATDTHSEYVIRTAFPWQQWLGERASVHIACLVMYQNCDGLPACKDYKIFYYDVYLKFIK